MGLKGIKRAVELFVFFRAVAIAGALALEVYIFVPVNGLTSN